MKVLIIGSNDKVKHDISLSLRVRYPDAEIHYTDNGKQGVKLTSLASPDLVMINSLIEDLPALNIITRIREFSEAPIIVIEENNGSFERAKAFELGADEYITVPIVPIELLAKIRGLLRQVNWPASTNVFLTRVVRKSC